LDVTSANACAFGCGSNTPFLTARGITAAGRRILPAFTAARSASSEELNKLAL